MSSDLPIGQAIRHAYKFIRQIHADSLAVVGALDALLLKQGWVTPSSNRISWWLSNAMEADRWLLRSIIRLYSNTTSPDQSTNNLAVQIDFEPPDFYESPVCLCIVATFPTSASFKELWATWYHEDSGKLLEHLQGKGQPQPIPSPILRAIFPRANVGKAFAVNLCDLRSEPDVMSKIVNPLLSAVDGN